MNTTSQLDAYLPLQPRGDKGVSLYKEISDNLQKYIVSQNLSTGDKLPTVRELVKIFEATPTTIDRALQNMEAQGLIVRKHGKGIFVADRIAAGGFAIVMQPRFVSADASPFYGIASTAIIKALAEGETPWKAHLHLGQPTDDGRDFPQTLHLHEPNTLNRLRGIFSFLPLYELDRILQNQGVPVVYVECDWGNKYNVCYDRHRAMIDAIEHLRARGCKSIGAIIGCYPGDCEESAIIKEASLRLGLDSRPEWLLHADGNITELMGYELLRKLWSMKQHPDALIVTDDVMCRGVLRGILHFGIKLPEDISLVTRSNQGVELPYHKPITRIESDPVLQGRKAVEMMRTLLAGKTRKTFKEVLHPKLIKGLTT